MVQDFMRIGPVFSSCDLCGLKIGISVCNSGTGITPQSATKDNVIFHLLEEIFEFWKKILKSFFKPILWDTKIMNTTSKLCLYCSIERNFENGEARIFLFGGFGVGLLILIKFLNPLSKNFRVGLEWKIFWSRLWMH